MIFVALFLLTNCGARQEKITENKEQMPTQKNELPKYEESKQDEKGDAIPLADTTVKVIKDTVVKKTKSETKKIEKDTKKVTKKETKKETKKGEKDIDTVKVMVENSDGTLKKTTVANNDKAIGNKKFYIVGGSYKKAENAKKLDKFFKSKGVHSQVLTKNTFTRVAVSSHKTKKEAAKEIKKFRNQFKDIRFWILLR